MTYGSRLFTPYTREYSWPNFQYSRSRCNGLSAWNRPLRVSSISPSSTLSLASKSPGAERNSASAGVITTSTNPPPIHSFSRTNLRDASAFESVRNGPIASMSILSLRASISRTTSTAFKTSVAANTGAYTSRTSSSEASPPSFCTCAISPPQCFAGIPISHV